MEPAPAGSRQLAFSRKKISEAHTRLAKLGPVPFTRFFRLWGCDQLLPLEGMRPIAPQYNSLRTGTIFDADDPFPVGKKILFPLPTQETDARRFEDSSQIVMKRNHDLEHEDAALGATLLRENGCETVLLF